MTDDKFKKRQKDRTEELTPNSTKLVKFFLPLLSSIAQPCSTLEKENRERMERRKSELLDDVIMRFMRQSGLEMPLNQYRLIQSWADVAGQLVAEQTKEIFIRNQTLYVRVTSPAMRANLMMNRTRLTSLLNKQVGADVITNIALM